MSVGVERTAERPGTFNRCYGANEQATFPRTMTLCIALTMNRQVRSMDLEEGTGSRGQLSSQRTVNGDLIVFYHTGSVAVPTNNNGTNAEP